MEPAHPVCGLRSVRRFRIQEDFPEIRLIESRERAWNLWWGAVGVATLAVLVGQLTAGQLLAELFLWLLGVPIVVFGLLVLPRRAVLRIERRERTVTASRSWFLWPYRWRRFGWSKGRLAPPLAVVVDKASPNIDGVGCMLFFLGPVGAILNLFRTKPQPIEKRHSAWALVWIDGETGTWTELLLAEQRAELDRALDAIEAKFPDVVHHEGMSGSPR